jgi:hypothetical protein
MHRIMFCSCPRFWLLYYLLDKRRSIVIFVMLLAVFCLTRNNSASKRCHQIRFTRARGKTYFIIICTYITLLLYEDILFTTYYFLSYCNSTPWSIVEIITAQSISQLFNPPREYQHRPHRLIRDSSYGKLQQQLV